MNTTGIAAASGIRARIEALEMIANNLANTSTIGFKADRERYRTYWAAESTSALDAARGGAGASPEVESNWIDFSQGALQYTGVATHIALQGDAFLAISRGEETLFTRNGELQVSRAGVLVNSDGHAVHGGDGRPLRVDPAQAIEIRSDGSVWQGGATIGSLRLVTFASPQGLAKAGNTCFRWTGTDDQMQPASSSAVISRALEASNTTPAEGAIRMVNVLRQFEALQRALQLDNEMSKRLVDEVAKV